MYNKTFGIGLDLDWFFKTKEGLIVHVASNGNPPPDIIDEQYVDKVWDIIKNLPGKYNSSINPDLQNILGKGDQKVTKMKYYISFFKKIANKGIFSFDSSHTIDPSKDPYHLVAFPSDDFLMDDNVPELKDLLIMGSSQDLIFPFNSFDLNKIRFYKPDQKFY